MYRYIFKLIFLSLRGFEMQIDAHKTKIELGGLRDAPQNFSHLSLLFSIGSPRRRAKKNSFSGFRVLEQQTKINKYFELGLNIGTTGNID